MKLIKKLTENKKKSENKTKVEFLHDVLLVDDCILVLGDLHIGYEEYIAEKGIYPRVQLKEIIKKLNGIFWNLSMKGVKIKQIIILGDLKHEFGRITEIEWSETLKFLDYLDKKIVKSDKKDKGDTKEDRIILVKGNHDNVLGPIAKKSNVRLVNFYKYKKICFIHGHLQNGRCFESSEILILGHLHPAITLSDEYKREKYKCFLVGRWRKKEVYVIPSFSPVSFGYGLNSTRDFKHDKEFLVIPSKVLESFDVIIYNNKEDKKYNFGKLRALIS
jgi:uncharacterized protein